MVKPRQAQLEERIGQLLENPAYQDNPLYPALRELWQAHHELTQRIDRISHISDAYQSLARQRELSLGERVHKQLRQLEKVARISDRYQKMMRDLNIALHEASTHDPLTGLGNRRLLIERLREETGRARRNGKGFALAMLDIDHFKRINDRLGHEVGDKVLSEVARVLDAEVRDADICGRWGGEEFLILLPETTAPDALQVVERVRQAVNRLNLHVHDGELDLSLSAGIAGYQPGESYSETINRADGALLRAKQQGRNLCRLAD